MSVFIECLLSTLLTFSICFTVGAFVVQKHKGK